MRLPSADRNHHRLPAQYRRPEKSSLMMSQPCCLSLSLPPRSTVDIHRNDSKANADAFTGIHLLRKTHGNFSMLFSIIPNSCKMVSVSLEFSVYREAKEVQGPGWISNEIGGAWGRERVCQYV